MHLHCWLWRLAHGRWRIKTWSFGGRARCLLNWRVSQTTASSHHFVASLSLVFEASCDNWWTRNLDRLNLYVRWARRTHVVLVDGRKFAVLAVVVWVEDLIGRVRRQSPALIHESRSVVIVVWVLDDLPELIGHDPNSALWINMDVWRRESIFSRASWLRRSLLPNIEGKSA